MTAKEGLWEDGGSWASLLRNRLTLSHPPAALRPVSLTTRMPEVLLSFLCPILTTGKVLPACLIQIYLPGTFSSWTERPCGVSHRPGRLAGFVAHLLHSALCLVGLKEYLN